MVGVDIDSSALVTRMTDIEKRQLPKVVLLALGDAAIAVHDEWKAQIPSVFDRPTPLTLRSPRFQKATVQNLTAEVYILDEVSKGRSPADYLREHVFPGARPQRRGEQLLGQATGKRFYVPSRQAPLDQFGNPKRGLIGRVLSQLQASRVGDQNETAVKRNRRLARQRRRGGGGSFFVVREQRGKLRRGVVYERIDSAFGSAVRPVFTGIDSAPTYRKRYDVFKLARELFGRRFASSFQARLSIATRGRL